MSFKDIKGNTRVKNILRKSLQKNRMPNSLLFYGHEGVGKMDTAMVVAKALNCEQATDDACERCSSCKSINSGNFPDVMVISPEKDVIKINQIRMLKKMAYLKPMIGKKRVFIVKNAEKMKNEAANSLLKVLEEPPLFSYIILLTQNPYIILPTIKSRCQMLSFSTVSREDIEELLIQKGYEKEKARIISIFVQGNLKQALSLEWDEVEERRKEVWNIFLSCMGKGKLSNFFKNSSSQFLIRKEVEQTLEILSSFFRDLILIKENGDEHLLMNPDYREETREVENVFKIEDIMDFIREIDYALYGVKINLNVNLLLSSMISSFQVSKYV